MTDIRTVNFRVDHQYSFVNVSLIGAKKKVFILDLMKPTWTDRQS